MKGVFSILKTTLKSYNKNTYKKVKKIFCLLNYTKEEFSEKCLINPNHLIKIINNKKKIDIITLKNIVRAFNLNPLFLYYDKVNINIKDSLILIKHKNMTFSNYKNKILFLRLLLNKKIVDNMYINKKYTHVLKEEIKEIEDKLTKCFNKSIKLFKLYPK